MTPSAVPILDLQPELDALGDEIRDAIDRVIRSGRFIMGPEVEAFEEEAARYLGVGHAIGVNSGTDALVIGLRALGVGPGDEVITTPFTFFATAESISLLGARPVFVDIDARTFNLDPDLLEAAITPRTKAIVPVHLYGRPCAMTRILEIASRHDLRVLEDCAQSMGATYQPVCSECGGACDEGLRARLRGKQTGTMGHVGAYSFFPSKTLGAYGDGGLIATDDDELADTMRMLRVHGARTKYHNEVVGYNSRLDAMQAAILRVKLPHLDAYAHGRRRVAQRYTDALADLDGLVAPDVSAGHVFHQYTVRIPDGRRDAVADALDASGIQTMVYYPIPQDRLPIYAGQHPPNPVSDRLAGEVLSLPIWPQMDDATQDRVIDAVRRAVGQ
jgi:dTDP-4-amino-4,6-dideoxygalactose transaminase